MIFYVQFRLSDGVITGTGHTSDPADLPLKSDELHGAMPADEDPRVYVDKIINGQTFSVRELDLEPLRRRAARDVEAEAAKRMMAGPRAAIHAVKAAEARGKGAKPLLTAEAAVTGQKLADLVATVKAKADEADAVLFANEVKLQGATFAIAKADTLLDLAAAVAVAWDED